MTLPVERCWHRMHGLSGTQHDNIILLQPNWRPKIGVVFPAHEPFCSVLRLSHDRKVSYLQHWSPYSSNANKKNMPFPCRFRSLKKQYDLKNISQSAIQVTSACSPTWWQEIYEHQHHSGPLFPFSWTYDWGIGIAC